MGWRRWCAGVAAAVIAVLLPVGAARAQEDLSDLSVRVDREGSRVVVGRLVTYTIGVANPSDEPVTVTLRASVPPWFTGVTADDADLTDGHARWRVTVPPGGETTVRLSGVYESGVQVGDVDRVSLTACVLDDEGAPVRCATDAATLHGGTWLETWWWALVGAALAAVGLVAWHRRRAVPAPATTDAASPDVPAPVEPAVRPAEPAPEPAAAAVGVAPVPAAADPASVGPPVGDQPSPGDPTVAAGPTSADPTVSDPVAAETALATGDRAAVVDAPPPGDGPRSARRRVKPAGRSRSRRRRAAPAR